METGSRFTIVAVAEGAISKEDAALSKKEYKKKLAERTSPSIVYDIAKEIEAKTGRETRVAIPGHTQRGGQPDARGPHLCDPVRRRGSARLPARRVRLHDCLA